MSAADLLRAYVEVVWTDGRLDQLPRFAHPDMVLHSSEADATSRGLTQVAAAAEQSRAPFDPYVMSVDELVGDDPLIAWRWSVRAKLRSPLALGSDLRRMAMEIDDLLWVSFGGMCFTRFRDGLIVEERVESNPLPLLRQFGVPAR